LESNVGRNRTCEAKVPEDFQRKVKESALTTEIQTGLIALDVAQSVFAAYAGVPATRLSQCLSGVKSWDPKDLAACEKALREMLDLAKSVEPLPIDFRKVGLVRTVLESRRMMKTWTVRTAPGQVFAGLDASYRPVFDATGLALTGEAAHQICSELRKLNYRADAISRQLLANERSLEFRAAWKPR
jgi:hypothetical protein